uniref:Cilium assembly protein DZIP1 N-terminal domain-containing protein n=1 Tax=Physcomitrium patens TaxID=3218 RepID=A0A7I4CKC1_PHYPA
MEQNPSRIRKAGEKTTTVTRGWRTLHLPLGKKFLSISSNNVDLSLPPEAMMSTRGNDDPLMVIVSSTGYSTDSFEHDEEQIIMDSKKPKTPRKNMTRKAAAQENSSTSAEGVSFVFQKHHSKIDWRILNTIDVDRIIRDVDTDTLEKVMDTIAFGDIHGEDARNITEGNFTKIFRLAQLMVEYLLHALQLLADQKSELLQTGAIMQQKSEKIRQRFLCQRNVLLQTRHELKQAKETLKTDEVMLESQSKTRASRISQPQDLHIARRHPKPHDVIEDRIIAIVSKPEDATAARTKAETNIAVQREIQQLRERYQADLQRAETSSTSKVRSLQAEFRQSNNQLHEVQTQLDVLQAQILHSPNNARLESVHAIEEPEDIDNGSDQERLYNLKSKSMSLEQQVNTLGQEKLRLLQKLNVACAEVEDLLKENQYLKKTMSKAEEECTVLSVLKQKQIAPSPRERWTREPEKDQALLALARPASRRRTEVIPAHNDGDDEELNERKSSPEPQPCRHSTSPAKRTQRVVPQKMKYETSPDRSKKLSLDRLRTSVVIKKGKPRGNESPTTVEEMRARLEKEMVSAHEEQQRRQKAVQRLLAKEMAKERVDEKKNQQRKKGEDARSCNSTTQYPNSRKSEFPCESGNEREKRITSHEEDKDHKIQVITEVAAMDVGEDAPITPTIQQQKWLSNHPFVPITSL